ncbi:variant surface glycoprotein (VSG, atypical), putative [Trypanosoma equiperdum]|uniref:Variant surface glycoprotein (VSG, atypical), putative n=2 Tax=Trypanozoon TaxID=39700 RepID=Q380X7_TRYB2|nr:variant surface glycoprotein [Trypanosoma brucei brucei TREU927]EAN80654.1 variant surface glycoprotein (VSG, atypical), putative [Trypanosoma brucei brucei TREU927]SCU72407.1 variant surface glycoprotein (VSG, atypical), putative [Trypanosoma equiperdum]
MLALLFLALIVSTCPAEPAANDVALEFNALCELIGIARARDKIPKLTLGSKITKQKEFIIALNMSVSSDTFFNQKFDRPDAPTGESPEWQKNKKTWQRLQKIINDKSSGAFGRVIKQPPDTEERELAATLNNQTVAAAEALTEGEVNGPTDKEIQDLLQGAVSGKGGAAPADDTKTFGTVARSCGGNGADNTGQGKSLANDILCLCSHDSSNAGFQGCAGEGATQIITYTRESGVTAALTTVTGKCKINTTQQVTAHRLAAAITNFKALLGRHEEAADLSSMRLGKGHAGNTRDGGGAGGCILYKGLGPNGIHDIPWVKKLEGAQHLLLLRYQAIREEKTVLYGMTTLRMTAEQLHKRALLTKKRPAGTPSKEPETKNQQITDCKQHKNNKTECENAGKCKWEGENETKGECKAKQGSDTPEAGTGDEATGTTTDKCKGKSQTDCKDGCKWDGKECKDSSILATKKFALMVSSSVILVILQHYKDICSIL